MGIASRFLEAKDRLFPISDVTFQQCDSELDRVFNASSALIQFIISEGGSPTRKSSQVERLMAQLTHKRGGANSRLDNDGAFLVACRLPAIFPPLSFALSLRVLLLKRHGQVEESAQLAQQLTAYQLYRPFDGTLPSNAELHDLMSKGADYCKQLLSRLKADVAKQAAKEAAERNAASKAWRSIQSLLKSSRTTEIIKVELHKCLQLDLAKEHDLETARFVSHKFNIILELFALQKKSVLSEHGLIVLLRAIPQESTFRIGGWSVDPKGFLIANVTPTAGTGARCGRTYTTHYLPDGSTRDMGSCSFEIVEETGVNW